MSLHGYRRSILAVIAATAGALPAASAATLAVPVRADIASSPGFQTIGEIVANDRFRGLGGPTAAASGLTATFSFADDFSFLDDRYDFDWVQIVDEEQGDRDFFPEPLPTIDPRPINNPDDHPFYYSVAEWNANTFAGQTIHVDGMTSTFGDVPNQPEETIFSFSTFLIARDDGMYGLDGEQMFCVLGGFTWTYEGAVGDFDSNRGTSTVGEAIVGPIDPRLIDRINAAIDSAAEAADSDDYRAWRHGATGSCTLVPEPTAVVIMLFGVCWSSAWRRPCYAFHAGRPRFCRS